MSQVLDLQYIKQLNTLPSIRNFKQKKQNLFVCSCPICGDSEKDKKKARGNFFLNEGKYIFHCYNCDITMSLSNFLKSQDVSLYDQYMRDLLLERKN